MTPAPSPSASVATAAGRDADTGAAAVHVLSGGAAKGIVVALQPTFTAATGAVVAGVFGAVGAMRDRLLAGDPCDVAILTTALIDQLVTDGHVVAGTQRDLGRVPTGIAVRDGDPRPDVSDGAALAAALLAAPAIYLPDPERATAGIHFMRVIERLGIRDDVGPALRPHPNGAVAMAHLASEGVAGAIGCTQVTEILYTAGVRLVAPLPAGFGLATVYTAAVGGRCADPALAGRLVELLAGSASIAIRGQGGFTV